MKRKSFLKKMTALTLIVAMAFSLSACGGQDSSDVDSGDEIIYTMGRLTTQNAKMPDGDTYEDNAYTRYVKDKLNAVCVNEFEATGEDYDRQVSLAIASGELPDMMRIGNREILTELIENDLIADLTDVYDEYASDYLKSVYDSYGDRALGTATYDGRLMAIPATNVDSAPNQVWIRQDWMEKLGLKIDEDENGTITLDELEMVAKEFIDKDPGDSGNPVGIPMVHSLNTNDYGASAFAMTSIANAFGAHPKLWLEDENGKVYNGSNTEETKESLGLLRRWFSEGILDPQFGTRTWDDISALLTNGRSGIAFGAWHTPDWLFNNVRSMDNEAIYESYVLEDANGKANVFHNNASNGYMVVRKDYEHPELAIEITNLFFDELANSKTLETDAPEVAQYQESAVDGAARPFNIEVNKYTSLLDDYSDIYRGINGEIEVEEARTVESRVNIDSILRYLEDPENADVADWAKYHSRMKGIGLIEKLTNDGTFNWVEPVFWGTTETMKTNGANLTKLEEEVFIKIVTGSAPLDAFDTYVEEWNNQGGAQIIEEIEAEISKN